MALIECPECKSQVSTKAESCPHCGCPTPAVTNQVETISSVQRPNIAPSLDIGRLSLKSIDGYCFSEENYSVGIPESDVKMHLADSGLRIANKITKKSLFDIHFSQLLSISYVPNSRIWEREGGKSVIKRAVVGHLILGPLGAVVGGMSGVANKRKVYEGSIIINFWDVKTESPQTILVSCSNAGEANDFCMSVESAQKGRKDKYLKHQYGKSLDDSGLIRKSKQDGNRFPTLDPKVMLFAAALFLLVFLLVIALVYDV